MIGNNNIKSMLWIIFYLVLIDIGVNIIFKFPPNPQKNPPSLLQGYFEYGRSIEGKFKKMAFAAQFQTDPTLGYGWVERHENDSQPRIAEKNQTLVAVYGMSHTKLLADAMSKLNNKFVIRSICAPGAPVGWGYTAYSLDKDQHFAEIVIWGIMTDNVPFIGATLGATIYFDLGHPYTFPRYYVKEGTLKIISPPFLSQEGYHEYRNNRSKWQEYIEWLKMNDKFYDSFLFKEGLSDCSVFVRVIRRAYAETVREKAFNRVYTKDGFKSDSEEIVALRMMVEEFAESARKKKRLPVIYIVNNRGRGNHLYKALKPTLDEKKIPFLSSHFICPPDDPNSFIPSDPHFTPAKDFELAKEMIRIIEKER